MLYFDHNATHPLSETAKRAWLDAVEKFPANPSSPHRLGQRAEKALDDARERLAALMGCGPSAIVWTSGATESANTIISQVYDGIAEVWTSATEHPCVLEAAKRWDHVEIPVGGDGLIEMEWLGEALGRKRPGMVAVMAANNETGVIQDWRAVDSLCRRYRVPFFCDAAQWVGKMSLSGLGQCDMISGCAHKFGGPQGVGFFACARHVAPLLRGGPQEDGRRAGTENIAGILSMVAALEECDAKVCAGDAVERLKWKYDFEAELLTALPGARVLGAGVERLWNTVSVIMPEVPDCRRRWVVVMDRLGFAVSTGSACASGKAKPSHVLTAMGISAEDAGRALRFSAGWGTTRDDWQALLEGVKAAARDMSSR